MGHKRNRGAGDRGDFFGGLLRKPEGKEKKKRQKEEGDIIRGRKLGAGDTENNHAREEQIQVFVSISFRFFHVHAISVKFS